MCASLPTTTTTTTHHPPTHNGAQVLHYQWFADFGNVDAARAVAHMLSHGAARDYEQAIRYLRQAAGAGDADAMAHLGHIHANGIGVPQDNSTAMSWFWKAAERGELAGGCGSAGCRLAPGLAPGLGWGCQGSVVVAGVAVAACWMPADAVLTRGLLGMAVAGLLCRPCQRLLRARLHVHGR